MAGIDEVLERLVTDPGFRERLAADPAKALAVYMLYDEDLQVLATALSEDACSSGAVEERTSKTTLAGLFDAFAGGPTDAKFEAGDEFVGFEHGEAAEPAKIEIAGMRAGASEVLDADDGNEIVLDNAPGSTEAHGDWSTAGAATEPLPNVSR